MASLLDLISAAMSPDLTFSETVRLREVLARDRGSLAPADRPWASGVPDAPRKSLPIASSDDVGDLKERVAVLELTVALLADQLVRSGVLDKVALGEAMREAHERAARMREQGENRVTCASCGDVVHVSESIERTTGTLCVACHDGTRFRRDAPTEEVRVEVGPYRGATMTVQAKTETCVGCGASVFAKEAYLSSKGALCAVCQAAAEAPSDE